MNSRKCVSFIHIAIAVLLLGLSFGAVGLHAQGGGGAIQGLVTDPSGGVVPNATVQVTAADGMVSSGTVGADGMYAVRNLAPGAYTVTVDAAGFAHYSKNVNVANAAITTNISLSVQSQTQSVTVSGEALSLDTTPSNNASAVVLSEKELDALPDDPDELQADLEALAGPGAGPNGGQMYIDGFTAGELPPKSSIREIRINSNPFSAEYDRAGFGRVEIFTKAGSMAWHGSTSVNRNQAAFNSRNPFAPSQGNFQSTQYNGNVGGGVGKKISLFFNADYRKIDNSSVINAFIPDVNNPANSLAFQSLNPLPQERLNVGPRFDYNLGKNNQLSVRYQYERNTVTNSGVGNFTLPVQGSNTLQYEDQLQITDSQYFGTRVVYETHFQYLHENNSNIAANIIPSVNIPGSFTGGGSGNVFDIQNHYELQSYTSVAFVKHFLKFGARLRDAWDNNTSDAAFFGNYQFSSLTAYQTLLAGFDQGKTMAQILAGNSLIGAPCTTTSPSGVVSPNASCSPTQYTVTVGSPSARVSQFDAGPFIQDDWKLRPNITLSYGLRFETQTHISDHMDWAPRVAIAYGLGGKPTAPKYVVRAGWGMFYDRFSMNNVLQANRSQGLETQYIVRDPSFYCGPIDPLGVTVTPASLSTCPKTAADLQSISGATPSTPTIYQIAPVYHSPYMMQTSASIEKQLTKAVQVSFTYLNTRGFDQALTENINAPVLPGTETPAPACQSVTSTNCGIYPNGIAENIYRYTSAGRFRQNQFTFNTTIRPSSGTIWSRVTLNAYYVLNYADTTPNGFTQNPYDIFLDYGPAGGRFGTRNQANIIGTIALPYGISFSPSVQVASGGPYTITIGKDLLGTSVLNQRPGVVSGATCANTTLSSFGSINGVPNQNNIYCTKVGTFDSLGSADGFALLGVNSLRGPGAFTFNVRLSKRFTFGGKGAEGGARAGGGPGAGGPGGGGPGAGGFGGGGRGGGFGGGPRGGGGGSGRGGAGGGGGTGRYSFTLALTGRNVFNNVNLATPVGNLTSPLFGESSQLANSGPGGTAVANRQFYIQGTFNF